jgi:hypothetical protein
MRGHRQTAASTLAEEPTAVILHGGVCEGEESMSTACRLLSTRKGPVDLTAHRAAADAAGRVPKKRGSVYGWSVALEKADLSLVPSAPV